tara:strand:+ start:2686 stop:3105 length:420 start_codon:yes stop_codon:yes gene_type:complete
MKRIATTFWLAVAIFFCFGVIGCAKVYRSIGVSEPTIEKWTNEDTANTEVIGEELRGCFWEIAAGVSTALGAGLTAILLKKLKTSDKINTVLIKGVEVSPSSGVKENISKMAVANGVSVQLHKKVEKLFPSHAPIAVKG